MKTLTPPRRRSRHLREVTAIAPGANRVDANRGIIRGVKICGIVSKNGRQYPADVLRRAAWMYEGTRININHPERDPLEPRKYEDRLGILREIECREDGLYGTLYINIKHPIAEQLLWAAENQPESFGMSHNVQAQTKMGPNGEIVVTRIDRVLAVDVVSDPATSGGLFEAVAGLAHPADDPHAAVAKRFRRARASVLNDDDATDHAKARRVAELTAAQQKIHDQLRASGILRGAAAVAPARPMQKPARRPVRPTAKAAVKAPKPLPPPKARLGAGSGLPRPPRLEAVDPNAWTPFDQYLAERTCPQSSEELLNSLHELPHPANIPAAALSDILPGRNNPLRLPNRGMPLAERRSWDRLIRSAARNRE